ncbi:MAG: hypothetical protein A2506_12945 [Elusimicrobia bacterium RIFOXYD12_FULL_66_9]|nr:MAG: hypothetical protein A2506_12945 [Elusimicrobia bacterium RIFOXYD12_FULL_66_9]
MIEVSVIILASRPGSLRRCLRSLERASPPKPAEVLLVLNGRNEECAAVAAEFSARLSGLSVLRDAPRSLGGARNHALARAHGSWLCFLDDDVTVPPEYFSILEEKLRIHPEAAALGGPNLTPPSSRLFERCIGHILSSPLAAGRWRRRCTGYADDTWTDDDSLILCNLCLSAQALLTEDLRFDEELVRNEENLILQQLFRTGRRAMHAPALFVYHERRSTLRAFARQCFLSGKGRAEMTVKLPGTLALPHLLVLGPAACVVGALFFPSLFLPWAAAYAALAVLHALWLGRRHREGPAAVWWLVWLMPAAHLSYAAGLLTGFISSLCRPRVREERC